MAEAEVFHRIWTHAATGPLDSAGLRNVEIVGRDAAELLPPEVLAELDDLLRKTTPAGNPTGYAVCRYAAGNDSFASVVATIPDLVTDAQGRTGLLSHARIVQLDPSDAWLDVPALVEAAEHFPIAEVCAASEETRLAAYLDLVASETSVLLRPVAVAELQRLPAAFLVDFLTAALANIGERRRTRFQVSSIESLVEGLALAWCALPARLQRTSSWAVAVGESCPVDALFSAASGAAPRTVGGEVLVDYVRRYVNLLSDAPREFHSILRNSGITDKVKLGEAVNRATVAAPLSRGAGRGEMASKEKGKKRDELDALDAPAIAELNRQYEALETELRQYVDARVADLEKRQLLASRQERSPFWMDARFWSPLLVAIIAMALFAWQWPRRSSYDERANQNVNRETEAPKELESSAAPPVTETVDPEQAVLSRVVTKAAASQLWAEAFKELLDTNGLVVAHFIDSAANDPEVEADATVIELRGFADKVARNQDLKPEGRDRLRALLVDYVAKRVASDDGVGPQVKVDGDLRDVKPPILARVKTRVGAKTAGNEAGSKQLQSEIVLRWMEIRTR
jgi:hypothetical protein